MRNSLSVILAIALKHLLLRKRQSAVAVLSVALGAMILVVTMCMMEGLLQEFREKLLESNPPVVVEPSPPPPPRLLGMKSEADGNSGAKSASLLARLRKGSPPRHRDEIKNFPELETLLKSLEEVEEVAPRACSAVVMTHGTRRERSILCGIEPKKEKKVTRLWRWMKEGSLDELGEGSGNIILGNILARHLSARRGSRVRVVSPNGTVMSFRVSGVFASGVTRIDDRQSFVRLVEGRRLAELSPLAVSSAGVGVKSLEYAEPLARKISRLTGLQAMTWEEANAAAIGAFRMMGVSTYFLVLFTAVVGGFGILNIMITIVMEKTRDIALLRAMGYTASQVVRVFFAEALMLGAVGGALGCLLGLIATSGMSRIPMVSSETSLLQRESLNMLQDPSFYLLAFALSLFVSVVAGVSPARRAAKVDPVSVLRGEK